MLFLLILAVMTRSIELPKSHGLTLSKFAPFHKGHQLLIETALTEVDTLTVIIYDEPNVTPLPLPIRANWMRQLYPKARDTTYFLSGESWK
jgi:cytidyltransferase-like protein